MYVESPRCPRPARQLRAGARAVGGWITHVIIIMIILIILSVVIYIYIYIHLSLYTYIYIYIYTCIHVYT